MDAMEFDLRKALTNYRVAIAMRVEGQPKCPKCAQPWPFIDRGCEWCGLPERPDDPIAAAEFAPDLTDEWETFLVHRSCGEEMRWDHEKKGEYPMPDFTDSMVSNAYLSHVFGNGHHGWPDESCPLCWNLAHRLPERWEPGQPAP